MVAVAVVDELPYPIQTFSVVETSSNFVEPCPIGTIPVKSRSNGFVKPVSIP